MKNRQNGGTMHTHQTAILLEPINLRSYDVTFLYSKGNIPTLDLTAIPSITKIPKISISSEERSRVSPNKNFNPVTIANFWLHLLLIQTFSGNFIRYDAFSRHTDTLKDYNDTRFQITKLTDEQCQQLKLVGERQGLHPTVLDLYCLFPYTSVGADSSHHIIPHTTFHGSPFPLRQRLVAPFPAPDVGWQDFLAHPKIDFIDRGFWGSCPLLPPHWFVLTTWSSGEGDGVFAVLDVKTGLAFEIEEGDGVVCNIDNEGMTGLAFDAEGKEIDPPTLKSWKIKEGTKMPAEDFLGKWIGKGLDKRRIAMPFGGGIMWEERGMRALEMKRVLWEFGWPDAFPLSIHRFRDFLARMREIQDGEWVKVLNITAFWREFEGMRMLWDERGPFPEQREVGLKDETVEKIDDEIWRIVTWERQKEHAFQLAQMSREEVDECFQSDPKMVTKEELDQLADEVMKRWGDLRTLSPSTASSELDRVHNLLQKAFSQK
jgi:hypothetical protein